MAERVRSAPTDAGPDVRPRYLVSWKEEDGVVRSAGPFLQKRADSLVQAFRELAPQRTYQVEPLPQAVDALKLGRVQRRRVARSIPR